VGPDDELAARVGRMLMEVLRRTHLSAADDLTTVVFEEARAIGVDECVLFLADYEQKVLVPVPGPDADAREALSVHGTIAGRCFASTSILETDADGGRRLWLPLVDGTERLGVLELVFGGHDGPLLEPLRLVCERYSHFVATLVASKDHYSDTFKLVRRRKRMTTANELLRALVPPQVMATDRFVLSTLLEPAYDAGGDAYDYALNDGVLHVGVFDGVGHGLAAAGVTAFALSVYRNSRRLGAGLTSTYAAIDAELADQYPADRYVTAWLAELDVHAGTLRWMSAGHPAPLLLRGGRFVKELDVQAVPPMGLQLATRTPQIGELSLEPGDMILAYTDGLTESRRPDGRLFTTERLAEFVERSAAAGEAAPETLRQLREAMIERGEGALRDDATAVLVEWRRGTERALIPETV
jgi:hypothetical protein